MSKINPIETFCVRLQSIGGTSTDHALAILWFLEFKEGTIPCKSGDLARHIKNSGLGNPNSTKLRESLIKSGHTLRSRDRFRLKPTSVNNIKKRITKALDPAAPDVPEINEFISKQVWQPSRGYIEKIAEQINGSYHCTFYDGASVLCRKLVEILIIESFEKKKTEDIIKDHNGDYFMLSKLIDATLGPTGLQLGRETKKILNQVKSIGDRSAHNRRYVAVKSDLDDTKQGYRLLIDELLHLAGLK